MFAGLEHKDMFKKVHNPTTLDLLRKQYLHMPDPKMGNTFDRGLCGNETFSITMAEFFYSPISQDQMQRAMPRRHDLVEEVTLAISSNYGSYNS